MNPTQLDLLSDTRLSREARIMGLHVSTLGEGEHEISHDEFRVLLGRGPQGLPHDRTIAGYVKELRAHGWVHRKAGGKGSPRYSFAPTPDAGRLSAPTPDAGRADPLPSSRMRSDNLSPHPGGGESDERGGITGGGAVSGEEVDESPPVVPPVDPKAAGVIEDRSADFDGCRGPLRDYLQGRVSPNRQYGYVQTLAGWIDGIDASVWKLPDGHQLPDEERTGYLAAALNELLAADETRMKRPVGDPGNLKTKLNILLRQREDHARSTGGANGGRAASRGKPSGRGVNDRWDRTGTDGG